MEHPMKRQPIRLTAAEIAAILDVAGDALAHETLSGDPDQTEEEAAQAIAAFESGMDKLRVLLARREGRA
jgi:hypothetical protein